MNIQDTKTTRLNGDLLDTLRTSRALNCDLVERYREALIKNVDLSEQLNMGLELVVDAIDGLCETPRDKCPESLCILTKIGRALSPIEYTPDHEGCIQFLTDCGFQIDTPVPPKGKKVDSFYDGERTYFLPIDYSAAISEAKDWFKEEETFFDGFHTYPTDENEKWSF